MRYVSRDTSEFLYGKNDKARACQAARECRCFSEDDQDEHVSDEPLSCLNCRYRRWTRESYSCAKGQLG